MGIGHRLADRLEDRQKPWQVGRRARPFGQKRGQGAALDQPHGEERPQVGERAQLVDRHDPRVLELAADLRFLDEAADDVLIAAVPIQQDLQGQVAAQVGVAGLEHDAHAAAGDLTQDLVAPGVDSKRVQSGLGVHPQDGRIVLWRFGQEHVWRPAITRPERRQGSRARRRHGPEGVGIDRERPAGNCPRLVQTLGEVHDFQASAQGPGQLRMGGDQPLGVGRPASLEMGQVRLQHLRQLHFLGGGARVTVAR